MKLFLFSLIFVFYLNYGYSQAEEARFRIFGEISTVENHTYKGFITWGGVKNYWIDFFEASKTKNPYARYFSVGDGIIFKQDGHTFATPPVHIFCCRFGNIKSIRPTGEKEILLQLKNGDVFPLVKGNLPDIHASIEIATPTGRMGLKWDHISEIRFMPADSDATPPEICRVAGVVKSTQGAYKGLIYWNYNKKQSPEKLNQVNVFLNKMEKVLPGRGANRNHVSALPAQKQHPENTLSPNTDILSPLENITINMPNTGCVTVPVSQFEELTVIPVSGLNLLGYDDFSAPTPIKGEVITRSNVQVAGTLAYDLDENLDIEVLDGKNNQIIYRIPFKYIATIEPKNYKYSFITLKNGSQLSLGEGPDVNLENSGIIVFGENETPTYIFWNEVKSVKIHTPAGTDVTQQ